MNDKKKNIPLIVALSIPVLMVVLITISIYIPSLFIKPQFNFIYTTGNNYCCNYRYSVQNEKIVQNEIKRDKDTNTCSNNLIPRLFYYDVQSFTSKEISFEEAQKYNLDSSYKSQDGFEVVSGNQSFDVFFYDGSSYYEKYLKKGAYSRRINIERNYYYNFRLLGWVKE